MISYYPPVEGAVITYEHSSQAKNPVVDPLDAGLGVPGRCAPSEDVYQVLTSSSGKQLEVTPEEDDAWNHMTMIAGSTV